MGTLIKPVMQFTSYLISLGTVLWLLTLACDRVYSLLTIYRNEVSRLADEAWLRNNCQDPVFYTNLRGHTDICTHVEQNARRNLALFALKEVMQSTFLCGTVSCSEQMAATVTWFMTLSMPLMVLITGMAFLCPVILVQLVRVLTEAFRPSYHQHGGFYSLPVQPQIEQHPPPGRYPLYRLPCFEELDEAVDPLATKRV